MITVSDVLRTNKNVILRFQYQIHPQAITMLVGRKIKMINEFIPKLRENVVLLEQDDEVFK